MRPGGTRCRWGGGQALQCADVLAQHKLKGFIEVGLHFGHPLGGQPFGGHDQRAPHQAAQLQFAHDQAALNGFAETDLIGQQIADAVAGNGTR